MSAICLLEVVCKQYFSLTKPLLLAQEKEKNYKLSLPIP